jgi:aspartate aminotransferase
MKAIDNLQSHSASNPVSISQKAALAAFIGDQAPVEKMRVEFEKRRNVMVKGLNAIDGVTCIMPEGAFYAFPNVSKHFGKQLNGKLIKNSTDFAALFLDEDLVAVVPGADFGAPDYIRFSYATDLATIEKGIARLKAFCAKLQPASEAVQA